MQRDLVAGGKALVGGSVGTFDDLFAGIARGNGDHRAVLSDAQRGLLLRRIARDTSRFAGYAETLGATLAELEAGLVEPEDLEPELADLLRTYRDELDRLERWDRDRERRYAADRVAGDLAAWDGRPVYAYGFEDLTAAQWALVEGLSARADVTVSLPYEPARLAFTALERTAATLSKQAAGRIEELPAAVRALRAARAGASRAPVVRRRRRACSAPRGSRALPRGAGCARRARARRRGDPRAHPGRNEPRLTSRSWHPPWSAGARRSRRRSPGSASRTRPRARRGSARRRSAAHCSRCSASRGSAADVTTSTGSCGLRTRVFAATTSTSSKDGCAGAPSTRRSAWRRRRSGCAASRCRSSTRCVRAARTRRR